MLQGPEDSLVPLALMACLGLWAHRGHHLLLMVSWSPDTVKPLKSRRVHLEQGWFTTDIPCFMYKAMKEHMAKIWVSRDQIRIQLEFITNQMFLSFIELYWANMCNCSGSDSGIPEQGRCCYTTVNTTPSYWDGSWDLDSLIELGLHIFMGSPLLQSTAVYREGREYGVPSQSVSVTEEPMDHKYEIHFIET